MLARIVGLIACALATSAGAGESQRWQRVVANDAKIGQVQITRAEDADGVRQTERLEMLLGKSGRRVRYLMDLQTESGADGSLRRMVREVRSSEAHTRVEARVVGDDLEASHGVGKGRTVQRLAGVARDLKTDEFARAWLIAAGRGESPAALRYRSWDPVKFSVVDIEFSVAPSADGNVVRKVWSARGNSQSFLRVDAAGEVERESSPLGGLQLHRETVSAQEAQGPNAMFDHVAAQLQKSPYRIPSRELRDKIRYRFANHGQPAALPTGAGQRSWSEGGSTWIQVCASCPLDAVPLADEERARALSATPWLEADDAQLRRRARNNTAPDDDAATKMRSLTTFVRGYMGTQIDMLGYGTATEAFRTRRGDCTEFAVLLAALGRAAGVPTRIAIGRVYARQFEGHRHVFVPHAWVQAWTGSGWESFDAAIGRFDSTHLAFAVSYDGDPLTHYAGMKLSRDLELQGAARVVPRKAN